MLSKILKFGGSITLLHNIYEQKNKVECCGIIGFVGQNAMTNQVLSEGYDSSGIVTIENNEFIIDKQTSNFDKGTDCIQEIIKITNQNHLNRTIGIAHTRWATCGDINNKNAHPHTDNKNRIALVHNGTIYNYENLKNNLLKKGYQFQSQTDTEVIAVLIGSFLDQGETLINAIQKTCEQLDGTWGLVIIHKDFPKQIICCRLGSPLLIGFSDEGIFVSSEAIAFLKYTNQFFRLNDREIIQLNLEQNIKESFKERIISLDKVEIKEKPQDQYRSFFEEEIWEQSEAIKKSLSYYHRLMTNLGTTKLGGFDSNQKKALEIENMVLTGCGSSFNACLYGQYLFKVFNIFQSVICVESSDFNEYDIQQEKRGVICITQSGESADVLIMARLVKEMNIPLIGITNVVGSMITTLCDWGVFQNSGREIAVGATKSFTTQIVILYLIVLWYSYYKNIGKEDKHQFERNIVVQLFPNLPYLAETSLLMNKDKVQNIAKQIYHVKTMYVLGKGSTYPFAREIALKLKEMCYIHAEAILAGELKHGPLAMINSNYETNKEDQSVVIIIVLNNINLERMILTLNELKTRKAFLVVITDCIDKLQDIQIDSIIEIPHCKPFGPILSLLPCQLLINEISVFKNINPDKPRNLAKCVTVL